ncbi:MAG: arylsulfatase [Planctomycetota bacterium]
MCLFIFASVSIASEDSKSLPNIVLVYTDDQGFGDFSAINTDAKFDTSNLDRLAREGITFTNGHSPDSVCTPSRYGLLTGRYAWRTHLKRGVFGAESKCLIEKDRMTMASMLRQSGYQTAMIGKWHLGMDFPGEKGNRDWSKPTREMPLDRGFDHFFGIPASLNYGVLAWFDGRFPEVPPKSFTGKKPNQRHVDYRIMPPYEESSSRKFSLEVAEDFIDNQCLTRFTQEAIEWIGEATDEVSSKPFFLYLPLTSPHYPVCPLPEFHGMGKAGAYGEFMVETDYRLGEILTCLDERGLTDNTIVIFTSDNGPEKSWQQRIEQFGHDSRGGLRGGKRSVYEGGHRVPFVIRWPDGIKEPGRRCDALVGQVDLLATLAELVGIKLPGDTGEDSHSFASVFQEPDGTFERVPLITHGNGGGQYRYAITTADTWKLVLGKDLADHELYNLSSDRDESENLAKDHPQLVRKLVGEINNIIVSGRSTPGPKQTNDTGYWKDLVWMESGTFFDQE